MESFGVEDYGRKPPNPIVVYLKLRRLCKCVIVPNTTLRISLVNFYTKIFHIYRFFCYLFNFNLRFLYKLIVFSSVFLPVLLFWVPSLFCLLFHHLELA